MFFHGSLLHSLPQSGFHKPPDIPDLDTFRCLPLALEAARTGGTAGAILNGANEAAVARFLEGKIGFLDIAEQVARAMDQVPVVQRPTLEDILEADRAARAV